MAKVEITDEKVERAADMLERWNAWPNTPVSRRGVRAALDAALNPPEPEIPIAREQIEAGVNLLVSRKLHLSCYDLEDIYRAMRRLEPKGAWKFSIGPQQIERRNIYAPHHRRRSDDL